jgi:peptidoglycan hydrolase CwlO-like protein
MDVKKIIGSILVVLILIAVGYWIGTRGSAGEKEAIRDTLGRTENRLSDALEATRKAEGYIQFLKGEQLEDKRRLTELKEEISRREEEITRLREKINRQEELIDAIGAGIDKSEEIIRRIQERNERSLEIVRQL